MNFLTLVVPKSFICSRYFSLKENVHFSIVYSKVTLMNSILGCEIMQVILRKVKYYKLSIIKKILQNLRVSTQSKSFRPQNKTFQDY